MINADPGSWPRPHRVNVDEYRRMGAAGVFARGERLEMIDRANVDIPPVGSRHAVIVTLISDRLTRAVELARGDAAHVRNQMPLRLEPDSEPQPDVTIVRGEPRDYWHEHPGPSDVLLAVEVAESTLRFDLHVKARLYAAHRIPEYWVVDVEAEQIVVLREPTNEGYGLRKTVARGSRLRCGSFDVEIATDDVLAEAT